MIELMADLFSEGYGGKMNVDRQRVGITWGTFTTHMYIDYYSFQYSIGISAAHALGKRILDHQPNAVEDYLNFLKGGSSVYGIDLFKQAGVDMTTSKPVEDTFAVLEGYVDRLEKLTSR
jgi:oligoendopeptidase F